MQQDTFFALLAKHFEHKLPFVAYRKPNEKAVQAVLQFSDELFYVNDFTESGFVFAPFNAEEPTILFPIAHSEELELDIFEAKTESTIKATTTVTEEEQQKHIDLVAEGVVALQQEAGFKKVVLSRKEVLQTEDFDALAIFQKLLATYDSAFCYLWFHPKVGLWLGATPETLLQVYRNKFATMALAGTQKFEGSTEVEWGIKEQEEQQIVTDAIVAELRKATDKLKISAPHTHKAGNLLHLKTDISGLLPANFNAFKEVVLALHPTPAVCGLPKERAKDFILNNEHYTRTFYSGFLGELNKTETIERNTNRRNVENSAYKASATSSHLFVNLRSMEVVDDEVHLFVGGGITAASNPEAEWEETVHKTGTMKSVLF